jgi:hypothetical protein
MPCPIIRLTVGFAFIALSGGLARATVPPPFVVQQQDRAVDVYCNEWRNTHGKLEADQMNRRVITALEEKYPAVFPDCRPRDHENCASWLTALVEGLRRYGQRSLGSVCANIYDDLRM